MPENQESTTSAEDKSSNSILSRKLKKILDSQLENDKETQEALKELSTFFTDNTLKTRRHLRGEIERRSLQINQDFLNAFQQVKLSLDGVCDEVKAMNENCTQMTNQLQATKTKTQDLIRQTTKLQTESQSLSMQAVVVDKFIKKFQLTDEERLVLKGQRPNDKITPQFFLALERVQSIHRDCRVLLQAGQQTTALEIMEQMTLYQEAGLERLYRWTQSQCRNIEAPENSALLSQSMYHLQERPMLFKYVIDEYCTARRNLLVRAFIDALTVGGPGGTPRPIELHAHDPQRYIGDMLAWLHQATPSENENIHTFLKNCDKMDIEQTCEEALSSITEGVCRPLKTRVEQILLSEAGAVVLYKLTNLIRFYTGTIKQVISNHGALIGALEDLSQLAYNQFISVLQATVAQQTTRADPPSHDLTPTASTMGLLSLLKDIISTSSVVEDQQNQIAEIIGTVLDPLLQCLNATASPFPTTDQDVFLLNTLYQLHSTLALFQYTDARLQQLQSEMELHLDTLSSEQTSNLIANLGLQPVCTLLADTKGQPLSKVSGMDPASLQQFLNKFDSFLVAPDVYLLPQARLLLSSSHRKNINRRSLEVVVASYKQLYQSVQDPSNQYENPKVLMPKTPEQVNLLLQL